MNKPLGLKAGCNGFFTFFSSNPEKHVIPLGKYHALACFPTFSGILYLATIFTIYHTIPTFLTMGKRPFENIVKRGEITGFILHSKSFFFKYLEL